MNIAPAVARSFDHTVPAPAYAARVRYGSDLQAMGAQQVQVTDAVTLRATFDDTRRGVTTTNLVKDTLYGAKLVVDMPLTGIPYVMTNTDVVDALRALPGVLAVYDGTLVDQRAFDMVTETKDDADHLAQLLRDRVTLHTPDGDVLHAINIAAVSAPQKTLTGNGTAPR